MKKYMKIKIMCELCGEVIEVSASRVGLHSKLRASCKRNERRKHPDNGFCTNCKKLFPKTHKAGDTRLCDECYKEYRRQVKREHIRRKRNSK